MINQPEYCHIAKEYYVTSPRDRRIYGSNYFKLSTCMPTDDVISRLINIDNANQNKLYLLCPKYKDDEGGDIQLGITETQNSGFERFDQCALRGLTEELQIGTTRDSIEYQDGLDYIRKGKNYQVFFLDTDKHTTEHKTSDTISAPFPGDKALVCVYGTKERLLEKLQQFNPLNKVTEHDNIDALSLIPISELETILDHHKIKLRNRFSRR